MKAFFLKDQNKRCVSHGLWGVSTSICMFWTSLTWAHAQAFKKMKQNFMKTNQKSITLSAIYCVQPFGVFVLHLSHKPKRRSHFLSGYSISKKKCCEWFIFHPFKTHSLFACPRMVLKHVLVVLRIVGFLCCFFFFYPHLGRHFVKTPLRKSCKQRIPTLFSVSIVPQGNWFALRSKNPSNVMQQ